MQPTHLLYEADAYQTEAVAKVKQIDEDNACIALDQSLFYPLGGGQPGDRGHISSVSGDLSLSIIDTRKDKKTGIVWHYVDPTEQATLEKIKVDDTVSMRIDWELRHAHMRMHTCLHLLCAVVDAPVTGGNIASDKARLDFVLPEAPDKQALSDKLNALIEANHHRSEDWISDAALQDQPELIRTMSVKPPSGAGKIRLVNIEGVDLQPCGGTHVKSTGEIGPVMVKKVENKGKNNRRITVVPAA